MWHRISKPILLSVLFYFWFSLINQNIHASEIQKVEFQKRVVLCPWSSKDEESIALMTVSKNIEFVLNHLGVYIDYFDLDTQTLPNTDTKEFKEKYLGVLSYFINENTSQSKKWLDWLIQYSKTNLPWVALGKFGFLESAEEKKIKQVFEKYNFKLLDISSLSIASSVIPPVPNWMEYERKLPEYFESIPPIITLDKSAQLGLKLKLGFKLESTPVFISKTLSVAYSNYGLFVDAQARRKQWLVNPFIFFKKAFALNDDRLIPDVNVLNGRRVMFIHVDGDGFDSKSFIEQKDSSNVSVERYCGEILESEIFNGFYDFPFGVSLIVSEVDQDEEGNERLMENAKRIFALNNVEIGTHTYDHPLHWGQLEPYETSYNISKNKVPNLEKEIFGSVKYFKKLAQGKEVKTVHWSGDCVVGEKALEVSEKNNLLNINGGDSIYDTKHPSITYLSALGRPWGKYFQVFSGNANENIYTDGWKNNYYAFREVIETFQKTSDPIYKPINLYFHFYTGEREVSVKSLKDVLSWTRARPLSKVFPSTYVESVNGYRNAKISKNSNLEYIAENIQGLNTFRIDEAKNLFPQLNSSTGLIGYTHIKNSLYLFINPKSDRAEFKLTKEKNKSEGVFLEAVSGRISRFEKTSSLVKIDIDPFTIGPLVLSGINQTKVKIKFEGETKTIVVKNKSILIPFNYSVESRTLEGAAMTERVLIHFKGYIMLIAVVVLVVIYAIPNDLEMAEYYYQSYRPEDAENTLLKNTDINEKGSARALRNYLDLLMYQGRTKDALPIAEKLIQQKPKNSEYWKKYKTVLSQSGKIREAIYTDEKQIELGTLPATQENLRTLAHDYEWGGFYNDALRIYERLKLNNMLVKDDLQKMLSSYMLTKNFEKAEELAINSVRSGLIDAGLYLELYRHFIEQKNNLKAVQYAVMYLGVSTKIATDAWINLEYLKFISKPTLKAESALISDVAALYMSQNKKREAQKIFTALAEADALGAEQMIVLIELQITQKDWSSFYSLVQTLDKNKKLNERDWRRIARRLMWSGYTNEASAILNALLENKSPFRAIEVLPTNKTSFIKLIHEYMAKVIDLIVPNLYASENSRAQGRLETYKLLIEVHDAKSETEKSIQVLKNLLKEIDEDKILVKEEEEVAFREMLAERYSWVSKPRDSIEAVKAIKNAKLSNKGKALKAVSLFELNYFDESENVLNSVSTETGDLDASLLKRVQEIENEIKNHSALQSQKNDLNLEILGFQDSSVDVQLERQNLIWFKPYFLMTKQYTLDELILHAEKRINQSKFSLFIEPSVQRFMELKETSERGMIGTRYHSDRLEFSLAMGYQNNVHGFHHQAEARLFFTSEYLGYLSIGSNLYEQLVGTKALREAGITESQVNIYLDRKLNSYVELSISEALRSTHYLHETNRGRGSDTNFKAYLGKENSHLKLGPWALLSRWNSKYEPLKNLLTSRSSTLGVFGMLELGGGRLKAWRSKMSLGWGYDYDRNENQADIVFFEGSLEKFWNKIFSSRIEYAMYSGKFKNSFQETTHIASVLFSWSY